MDRNSFPTEFAIALLVLAGLVYIGRYVAEKTIPGSNAATATAQR